MPKGKNRATIAVDFDGVVHRYSKGWHDGTAYDVPLEGAIYHVKKLMEKYAVYIFTTRDLQQVQDWFGIYGEQIVTQIIPRDDLYWTKKGVLGLSNHKLVSFIWIDDRAIRFDGSWDKTAESVESVVNGGPVIQRSSATDGYHTFAELYEFRMLYNAALFNEWARIDAAVGDGRTVFGVHKSWHHSDEPHESIFGKDWFIVMAELPTGQISNHYAPEYWELFQVPETPVAHAFDGHTAQDVVERLKRFISGGQHE